MKLNSAKISDIWQIRLEDPQRSIDLAKEFLKQCESADDVAGQVIATALQAIVYLAQLNDIETGEKLVQGAFGKVCTIDDDLAWSYTYAASGLLHAITLDLQNALDQYKMSEQHAQNCGSIHLQAYINNSKGNIYIRQNDSKRALSCYLLAMEQYKEIGEIPDFINIQGSILYVYSRNKDYAKVQNLGENLLAEKLQKYPVIMIDATGYLAEAYLAAGNNRKAQQAITNAGKFTNISDDPPIRVKCLITYAVILFDFLINNDPESELLSNCEEYLSEAIRISKERKYDYFLNVAYQQVVRIFEYQSRYKEAFEYQREYHQQSMDLFKQRTNIHIKHQNLLLELHTLRNQSKQVSMENERLRLQASTDPLTRALNRRGFFEYFDLKISWADRYGESLALLILDLDNFKKINDTYGHVAGDDVLVKFCGIMKKNLRQNDFIGRIGGEEFAVCLVNAPEAGAIEVADKLRAAMTQLVIHHEKGEIRCTVSIGVTNYGVVENDNRILLLERADSALYEAKNSGRNKVVLWRA